MSVSEMAGADPYEAVLADLRAKREQIDQAIAVIESVRSGGPAPKGANQAAAAAGAPLAPQSVDDPGAFFAMTITDAAAKLLASRRKTMGNADIAAALKAGGLHLNSADPVNTIGSVLTRRFNQVGDIVKVGRGIWGLKEWYPNRSFKKDRDAKGSAEVAASDATASPAKHSAAGLEDLL